MNVKFAGWLFCLTVSCSATIIGTYIHTVYGRIIPQHTSFRLLPSFPITFLLHNCFFNYYYYYYIYTCIFKYNLLNPFCVAHMYMFRAGHLALDNLSGRLFWSRLICAFSAAILLVVIHLAFWDSPMCVGFLWCTCTGPCLDDHVVMISWVPLTAGHPAPLLLTIFPPLLPLCSLSFRCKSCVDGSGRDRCPLTSCSLCFDWLWTSVMVSVVKRRLFSEGESYIFSMDRRIGI